MGQGYDVVQMPAGISMADLPEAMEVGVPFVAGGVEYVLSLDQRGHLSVCEELDGGTTVPDECKRYYTVRRTSV